MDGNASTILRHIRQLVGAPAERELSDSELLRRFVVQRDEAAFTALVERHGGLVWGICRNALSHEQDAEDAFQATFLVLAQRAASLCRGEALAGWLYGAASRTAWKARTASARRRRRERGAQTMRRNAADAEVGLRELQAILDEEVGRLPAQRATFGLW
jgi:RNA polymerase sigma-70 factor (ECF subfamily)